MNRYQITADIDMTLWLGTLLHYKHVPSKIEYINLEELFESENVYFPTRDELQNQLKTVTKNLEYEFLAYLRELTDKSLFKIDTVAVYLPLGNNAFIATHGTANSFVDGEFEAIVEANVSKEDVDDIVGGALDRALDAVYQSSDYLSACGAVCLDVQKIRD